MFSNQVTKLIQDAVAINVNLRDKASNVLEQSFIRSPYQTARDFLTVTIGCGMRTGKTTALIELLRDGDLVIVSHRDFIGNIRELIADADKDQLNILVLALHDLPEVKFAPRKRIWIHDLMTFTMLEDVYKATADNIHQQWIRLV